MLNEDDILKLVDGIGVKEKSVDNVLARAKESPFSPSIVRNMVGPTLLRRRRGRQPGHKLSPETKEKIRISKVGVKRSEATKQRIKEANKENKRPIPMEVLLNTDLSQCKTYLHNRYINCYIPNPNYEERPFGWYLRLGRCIVEQIIGRHLVTGDEDVHYIDRNPLNNDPNNLCVLLKKDHVRLHKILDKIVPISEWKADAENCIWEDFKAGAL